jgi:hypothetical protein
MLGGVAPFHVIQGRFLMDIDQYMSVHGVGQTRNARLAWLEGDIAVRQADGRTKTAQPIQHLDGGREQPVGERVVQRKEDIDSSSTFRGCSTRKRWRVRYTI